MDIYEKIFYGCLIVLFIVVVLLPFLIPVVIWTSNCRKAEIFNEQNGTHWTCSDFFWASDQINVQKQQIQILK